MAEKSGISKLRGGCQCGDIRFDITGEPLSIYICHCRECQKQSSSAFGISMLIKNSQLSLLEGSPKFWTRITESNHSLDCFFCPTCGSRVWHGNPENVQIISIKGGALDDMPDLENVSHYWTSSKVPGVVIPAHILCYSGNPPQWDR